MSYSHLARPVVLVLLAQIAACATPGSLNETHDARYNTYLRQSPQQSGGGRDAEPLPDEVAQTLVHMNYMAVGIPPVAQKSAAAHISRTPAPWAT